MKCPECFEFAERICGDCKELFDAYDDYIILPRQKLELWYEEIDEGKGRRVSEEIKRMLAGGAE